MINQKRKRRLKQELTAERSTLRIGKNGATSPVISEISRRLKQKEFLKVRVLKSALKAEETANIASKIAEQTGSTVIEVRGHTILLYKRREKERRERIKE